VFKEQQAGVFTRAQARKLGFTVKGVRQRVDSGQWSTFAGALVTGPVSVNPPLALAWAAVLNGGAGAVLTGPLAMRLWKLEVSRIDPIVIVPKARHVPVTVGRTLRSPIAPEHVTHLAGLPIASPERAIIDTLMRLKYHQAVKILDRSLQLKYLTAARLRFWTFQMQRRTGVVQLRFLAERASEDAHSEAEHKAVRLFRRHGLTRFRVNYALLDVRGEVIAVIDIAFREQLVAVEIDGQAFHSDTESFQRDRARQNDLVRRGWRVLRFTWEDIVKRPDSVVAQVRNALGRPA